MMMAIYHELIQRVADEAQPPAELGRLGYEDWEHEILLGDLVHSHAWLAKDLKEWFLSIFVGDLDFESDELDPDYLNDPDIGLATDNARAFAAMEPIVDLNSLRGRSPMKGLTA